MLKYTVQGRLKIFVMNIKYKALKNYYGKFVQKLTVQQNAINFPDRMKGNIYSSHCGRYTPDRFKCHDSECTSPEQSGA